MRSSKEFHSTIKTSIVAGVVLLSVIMSLAGIWRVTYIAFQDYPSHLLRMHVLFNYDNPAYRFDQYLVPNWGLTPNQGADGIVFLLSHVFSIEIATKVFLSLYIVLLPLTALYFLRCTKPVNTAYILLPTALTVNLYVICYNENFVASIPLFLFFLGFWYKHRNISTVRTRVAETILAVMLYYCHMFTFVTALLTVGILCVAERKGMKAIVRAGLVFVPGIGIFLLWILNMITSSTMEDAHFTVIALSRFPSLAAKIRDLVDGISPGIVLDMHRFSYQLLVSLLALSMVILGLFDRGKEQKERGWAWVIIVFFALACSMPQSFIIYLPGPRMAFLALLISPVLFPVRRTLKYGFLSCIIAVIFVLRGWEITFLRHESEAIARVIAPFREIPPEVQAQEDKVLPLVLPPYTFYTSYHRVFEYYHIMHGGVNPYHLMSPDFTVRYRKRLPAPPQYGPFPETLTEEILARYDVVIVVGKDGTGGERLLAYLVMQGFREICGNDLTGVFLRQTPEPYATDAQDSPQ